MEIDFTELETFKKQLNEKRSKKPIEHSTATTSNEPIIDELDEYLDKLAIDLKTKNDENEQPQCSTASTRSTCNNDVNNKSCENHTINNDMQIQNLCDKQIVADNSTSTTTTATTTTTSNSTTNSNANANPNPINDSNRLTFPMLLLGFLSILAFVNSVNCKKHFHFHKKKNIFLLFFF